MTACFIMTVFLMGSVLFFWLLSLADAPRQALPASPKAELGWEPAEYNLRWALKYHSFEPAPDDPLSYTREDHLGTRLKLTPSAPHRVRTDVALELEVPRDDAHLGEQQSTPEASAPARFHFALHPDEHSQEVLYSSPTSRRHDSLPRRTFIKSLELEGSALRIDARISPPDGVERDHVRRAIDELLSASRRLAEAMVNPGDLLTELASHETASERLRREAIEALIEFAPEAEFLIEVIEAAPRTSRRKALHKMLATHPELPWTQRLLERLHTPGAALMRQLLFDEPPEAALTHIGDERFVRLFNAECARTHARSDDIKDRIAECMEARLLSHPELDRMARQELVLRIPERDSDALERALGQLLEQRDGRQLCEVLELLEQRGGRAAARAVHALVKSPEKIDTPSERLAMLGALRELAPHFDEEDAPTLDHFLCDLVLAPSLSVAHEALELLEVYGGEDALRRLVTIARDNPKQLAMPRLVYHVQRVVQALCERLGLEYEQGGLSLAGQQGGELTLTADAGGLELTDE